MLRQFAARTVLGLSLVLAAPVFAQTAAAPGASHLQVAREVVDLTGVSQSFDSIYAEFQARARSIIGPARPEMQKDMNEIIAALKPEADKRREEMTATAAEVFARRMTEADLKEVATFFKSAVGQRYNTLRAQAIDDIYTVLAPWSIQTSNFLFDSFQAEMRKRGHQF